MKFGLQAVECVGDRIQISCTAWTTADVTSVGAVVRRSVVRLTLTSALSASCAGMAVFRFVKSMIRRAFAPALVVEHESYVMGGISVTPPPSFATS